jgi:hypothetical protein
MKGFVVDEDEEVEEDDGDDNVSCLGSVLNTCFLEVGQKCFRC